MPKIQDISFFMVLIFLLFMRKPGWFTTAGLLSLLLAIPLFATWTFFTAERLTWYAASFFLFSILLHVWKQHR